MRFLSLIFSFLICVSVVTAQNPYEQFGVQGKTLQTASEKQGGRIFEVANTDTNSEIKKLLFNLDAMQYVALDSCDQVLQYGKILAEVPKKWLSRDPLEAKFPSMSPYNFCENNPVLFIDPDGRSTITAKNGKVLAVNDDGNTGVYKSKFNSDYNEENDGPLPDVNLNNPKIDFNDLTYMGETYYWDEFRNHDNITGEVLDDVQVIKIDFGEKWEPILEKTHALASKYWFGPISVGLESLNGGELDIKVPYEGQAKLFQGKYISARSAGNFLAGWNASSIIMPSVTKTVTGLEMEDVMKVAGTLHHSRNTAGDGKFTTIIKLIGTYYNGTTYGDAPKYGEIPYASRMIYKGWYYGKGR